MVLLLFDIDGTLIRCGGLGSRAVERTFAERFGWQNALAGQALDGKTDPAIFREALVRHGVEPREALLDELAAAYLGHLEAIAGDWERGAVLPGVHALLDALAARPVTLAILTGNCAGGARVKLERYGLAERFVCGAYGDDAARREDLLPVARERAGCGPEVPALVIGDTPADIAVARRHGQRAVAVATGSRFRRADLAAHAPDLLLDDLSAPAPLLALVDALL